MPLADAAKNLMLDELATVAVFVSLHTAWDAAGGSEVTGGSYARKASTWNAASGGNLDNSNAPVFDVPAATTVKFLGFWSASTAGTFYGMTPLGGAGSQRLFYAAASSDVFTSDVHGLVDGDAVVVFDSGSHVLPAGVTEGTTYFVRDQSGDTFKLAATAGGTAIDITVDGMGFIRKIVQEAFGSAGTLTLTDADISLNA